MGTDIDAGDYIILGDDGYYELCLTEECVIDDDTTVDLTVEDGQYLYIYNQVTGEKKE